MSDEVAALRVADELFLVASTIERCPKTMMIRELFMNAVEAATKAPIDHRLIEIKPLKLGGVAKLCIWNTGPGMSSEELHQICDIAACIGKDKGLDDNFGMGAKVGRFHQIGSDCDIVRVRREWSARSFFASAAEFTAVFAKGTMRAILRKYST